MRGWKSWSSSCHAAEHLRGDAMLHRLSGEEAFEFIHRGIGHGATSARAAASHMRRDNRAGQDAQRVVYRKRFVGIGNIERAAQTAALDLTRQSGEIDQTTPCNIDY